MNEKHKKISIFGRPLYLWKWGLNFNEGGDITLAINLPNLLVYFGFVIRKPTKKCRHGVSV